MSHFNFGERYNRPFSPKDLMVLSGPRDNYKSGSHWIVADKNGYAELLLMPNSRSYYKNSLYIENLSIKKLKRGRGYGKKLYQKVEIFARNIGVDYIQLDSEQEAVGFWCKMGFKKIDNIYYHGKTAMVVEV